MKRVIQIDEIDVISVRTRDGEIVYECKIGNGATVEFANDGVLKVALPWVEN